MEQLAGKVAVVTGGASGIGLALAARFGQAGMRVFLADIEADAVAEAAASLSAAGVEVRTAVCDVSDAAQMDALGEAVIDAFGAVHVVCNNAGVSDGGLVADLTVNDWSWVLGVNLWGVIHGVRVFLPKLLAQGEGHIVNTGSVLGLFSAPFAGPYAVSKFGVVALSETLFQELQMTGSAVGVSVLCPGWVSTRLHDAARNRPDGLQNDMGPAIAGRGDNAAGANLEAGAGADAFGAGLREALKEVIEAGLPPAEVAERVFDAVRTRQFYILTDEQSGAAALARAEAIAAQADPPLLLPS